MSEASEVVRTAESYYDSDDADRFYFQVWGGEDIHIGLYESDTEPIADASRRTVERMAELLDGLGPKTRVLDLGAGYGGAARLLAASTGCHVTCLNLSEVQNETNRRLTKDQGLEARVEVVHGSFEDLPWPDGSFDVVWSQDAILHSGDRPCVIREAARVLREGGEMVFTDPMQADDCPPGVLGPVLERIHLDSLGSFRFYRETAAAAGLREVQTLDLTHQLRAHYHRVGQELRDRREELSRSVSAAYLDRMIQGLRSWVDAADQGWLAWGILHFRRA